VYEAIKPPLSVYAKTCGINEALLNVEMTVAMNVLKENLVENIPKSDFQVIIKMLIVAIRLSAFPN